MAKKWAHVVQRKQEEICLDRADVVEFQRLHGLKLELIEPPTTRYGAGVYKILYQNKNRELLQLIEDLCTPGATNCEHTGQDLLDEIAAIVRSIQLD